MPAFAAKPLSMPEVLAASTAADWRPLDPENTLYVELPRGRVVIELAPRFAPLHVANIKILTRAKYFDALGIIRVQDNYVAQWGDPDNRHPLPTGHRQGRAGIRRSDPAKHALHPLARRRCLRPRSGIFGWTPGAARSPSLQRAWLAHCYGMVGVGRDMDVQSGSGAELYVVIGHAPRHLDRNVALVGRVMQGVELLSSLPRGSEAMGFYSKTEAPTPHQVHPHRGGCAGSGALASRSDTHRFGNLRGADRIAAQSARGILQGTGRAYRPVQCAHSGARAAARRCAVAVSPS
jgi:cyclophilin family peptidyl-prolyl cis-trans isomerase